MASKNCYAVPADVPFAQLWLHIDDKITSSLKNTKVIYNEINNTMLGWRVVTISADPGVKDFVTPLQRYSVEAFEMKWVHLEVLVLLHLSKFGKRIDKY